MACILQIRSGFPLPAKGENTGISPVVSSGSVFSVYNDLKQNFSNVWNQVTILDN